MTKRAKTGKWHPYVPTPFDREKLTLPPVDISKGRTPMEKRELQSLANIRQHRASEQNSARSQDGKITDALPAPGTAQWQRQWREEVRRKL